MEAVTNWVDVKPGVVLVVCCKPKSTDSAQDMDTQLTTVEPPSNLPFLVFSLSSILEPCKKKEKKKLNGQVLLVCVCTRLSSFYFRKPFNDVMNGPSLDHLQTDGSSLSPPGQVLFSIDIFLSFLRSPNYLCV